MRIIASVQSKRGSSRGLVHYLAHSKIDPDKEPEKGRELFNAFTDQLDVRNANNFLKSNCGKGRPNNDELHHLVLSFRPEDFQGLGSTDEVRKRRLKAVTRFAMSQLEKSLHSERLAWAGAVHLNTANPHVHIAIQKKYLTKDLRARSLNKIPREALPHFESINGKKQIVEGIFIESAKTKLEELIAERGAPQKHVKDQNSSRTNEKKIVENKGRISRGYVTIHDTIFGGLSWVAMNGLEFPKAQHRRIARDFSAADLESTYLNIHSDSMVQVIGFSLFRIRSNDCSISTSFGRTP